MPRGAPSGRGEGVVPLSRWLSCPASSRRPSSSPAHRGRQGTGSNDLLRLACIAARCSCGSSLLVAPAVERAHVASGQRVAALAYGHDLVDLDGLGVVMVQCLVERLARPRAVGPFAVVGGCHYPRPELPAAVTVGIPGIACHCAPLTWVGRPWVGVRPGWGIARRWGAAGPWGYDNAQGHRRAHRADRVSGGLPGDQPVGHDAYGSSREHRVVGGLSGQLRSCGPVHRHDELR